MKYIIYTRRSSEDKSKQIQSIPDQLEWANKKEEELGLDVVEKFTDTKTGTKPGRAGFTAMMEFIHQQTEGVGILCWKMDRLARNPIDEGNIKYAFMQKKIKHILANDRVFKEGESQVLMGVEFGSATQFSIDLAKNVNRGLQTKIQKGYRPAHVPLGYLNDPLGLKGTKKIFKDEERFGIIKKGWEMLLTGAYNVPQIKEVLDKKFGLKTKKGKRIARSSLYEIFKNPFYAGVYYWQGEFYTGIHTPMISLEDFDKAQIILGKKGGTRLNKHEHTFTGFIRCPECGCMITAEPPMFKQTKKGVGIYNYLRCSKKNPQHKCKQKYIREKELEKQIDEILASIEIPKALEEWALKILREENKKENHKTGALKTRLQREYNDVKANIRSLTDKLIQETIDNDTYKETKQRYEEDKERLKARLKECGNERDKWFKEIEKNFEFAKLARQKFEKGDRNTKREMLMTLGSNFLLKDQKFFLELNRPFKSIKKTMDKTVSIIGSLEPLKYGLDKLKKIDLNRLIPVWSHFPDSNRRPAVYKTAALTS